MLSLTMIFAMTGTRIFILGIKFRLPLRRQYRSLQSRLPETVYRKIQKDSSSGKYLVQVFKVFEAIPEAV